MTDVVATPIGMPRVHIVVGFGKVQCSRELICLSLRICEHLSWEKRVDTPSFQLQILRAYDICPNSSFRDCTIFRWFWMTRTFSSASVTKLGPNITLSPGSDQFRGD